MPSTYTRSRSENTGNSDESTETRKPKSSLWPTVLLSIVASLGSLTNGYALGYPSSALLELAELPGELAFGKGGPASELFVVRFLIITHDKRSA